MTEHTRESVDAYLGAASGRPGEFLFLGRRAGRCIITRQYARLIAEWIAGIGLDPSIYGTHSLRRSKATLIYRRKGGQFHEVPVDPSLAAPLRRHLHQHRPVLLSQRGRWYAPAGNALWISKHGSRCSADTFANRHANASGYHRICFGAAPRPRWR
jgi:integrase